MHPFLFALGALIARTAAECAVDNCLRAVQSASPSRRKEDCYAFIDTAIPTRTTVEAVTSSPKASKRWLQQHEVIDIMMGRAIGDSIYTSTAVSSQSVPIPQYAATCASSAAYASACSCLGITPTAITEATPSASSKTRATSITTSLDVLNSHTIANQTISSSVTNITSSRLSNTIASPLNEEASSSEKYRLKKPGVTGQASSTKGNMDLVSTSGLGISMGISNTTSVTKQSNTTSATASPLDHTGSTKSPFNSTASRVSNTTSSIPSLGTTISAQSDNLTTNDVSTNASDSVKLANLTTATAALFPNITSAAPPMINLNTTTPTALPLLLNSTHPPFANATNLRAPSFLNSTRIANVTSTPATATATPTPTTSLPCSDGAATASPFAVQVAQPGGPFDGWYLRLSGDGVIFSSGAGSSSRFYSSGGSLCAVSPSPSQARIAIAQNGTSESGGSAVWFVEPGVLEAVGGEGYAALRCGAEGGSLECEGDGGMRFWVGCGLGLDITRDGDGEAVVDGWNCTGVGLETVVL